MSEIRICKYCGMELSEDVPHGLRECHLHAVSRIAGMEWDFKWREESISTNDTQTPTLVPPCAEARAERAEAMVERLMRMVVGIKSGVKAMTKEIERLLSEEGLELKGLK